MDGDPIECPFCGKKVNGDYQIMVNPPFPSKISHLGHFANTPQLHIETDHPEDGPSPFVATDDASIAPLVSFDDDQDVQYVNCPIDDCGEIILLAELESHIEMHGEEQDSDDGNVHRSKRAKTSPEEEDLNFNTHLPSGLRNLEEDDSKPSPGSKPLRRLGVSPMSFQFLFY
jgi:hypothetical protein